MMNKQTSISQRLFTDLKHARVQLHGGPPALVSLRLLVSFSRCQRHRLIQVKKQAFPGHKLFTSRLQSM